MSLALSLSFLLFPIHSNPALLSFYHYLRFGHLPSCDLWMLIGRDYGGAVGAGIEGRLIRRQGEWSDGAKRVAEEDLEGVEVITSLKDVIDEVRARRSATT